MIKLSPSQMLLAVFDADDCAVVSSTLKAHIRVLADRAKRYPQQELHKVAAQRVSRTLIKWWRLCTRP